MDNSSIKHKFCIHCGKELEYFVVNCPDCGYKQPVPKINKKEVSRNLFSEWEQIVKGKSIISAVYNNDYWVIVFEERTPDSKLSKVIAITKDFKEYNVLKTLTLVNDQPAVTISVELYKVGNHVFVVTESHKKLFFINQNLQLAHVVLPIDSSQLNKFEIRDVVYHDGKILVCIRFDYQVSVGFFKKDTIFSGMILGGHNPLDLKVVFDFRSVFKDSDAMYSYTDSNGVVVCVNHRNLPGKGFVDYNHGKAISYQSRNLLRWEKIADGHVSNSGLYTDVGKFSYYIHEEGGGFAYLEAIINTAENKESLHEEKIKIYFPEEYGDFYKGEIYGIDHAFIRLVDNKVFMFRPYTKTAYVCEFKG